MGVSISIKTGSDVPKEFVPVMLALFGYLAEMESKRRSERVKAGIRRKVEKEGYKPGRKPGAKDNPDRKRKRTGYLLRYANKHPVKNTHDSGVISS